MRHILLFVFILLSAYRCVFSSSVTDNKRHNGGQNVLIATLFQLINQETLMRLSMSKKIDVMMDDISILQKKVTDINDENQHLKNKVSEYEKENANIKIALKQQFQTEIRIVKAENRLFKVQLAEYEKQITNLKITLKTQFITELGTVKKENQLFKEQLLEYKKQNTNFNLTLERMRQEQDVLLAEAKTITGKIKDLHAEDKLLNDRSSEYEKKIDIFNVAIQQIQNEQFIVFTEINTTTENVKDMCVKNDLLLKRQGLEYEKHITEINVTLLQLRQDRTTLHSETKSLYRTLKDINVQNKAFKERISKVEIGLEDSKIKINQINTTTENIKDLYVKNDLLTKRQGLEYEKQFADINVTLLQLRQDQTTLHSETKSLYRTLKDINIQNKAFQERISKVEIGLADCNITINQKPTLKISPARVEARVGQSVKLRCSPQGQGPFNIKWVKVDGVLSPLATQRVDGLLQIRQVTAADAGRYRCVAQNSAGSSNGITKVEVQVPPRVVAANREQSVNAGQNVTLQCQVTGDPRPTVSWGKKGGTIPSSADIRNGDITIYNVKAEDRGRYICTARSSAGISRDFIMLNVLKSDGGGGREPTIRYDTHTVNVGERLELECVTTGTPPPTVSWSKLGSSLPSTVSVNDAFLVIPQIRLEDAGTYVCRVENIVGSVEQRVNLFVKEFNTRRNKHNTRK